MTKRPSFFLVPLIRKVVIVGYLVNLGYVVKDGTIGLLVTVGKIGFVAFIGTVGLNDFIG